MPMVDDLCGHVKDPADLLPASNRLNHHVIDLGGCFLHRFEDYTLRLSKATKKSESRLCAEIHIFPVHDELLRGDPLLEEMGRRLRIVLMAFNKTQVEMAEELFVTPQAFSNYITADRPIPHKVLIRIGDLYSVPSDYILRGRFDGMTQIVAELIRKAEEDYEAQVKRPKDV